MPKPSALDWPAIDTVLLDMDGTLLDLRFDNWFWRELIPSRYAAANGLELEAARELLTPRFTEVRGTLRWYCIEYWSRELGLDIGAIKREAQGRVGFLPGAEAFLLKLKDSGKRCVLVTNAHPRTLAIKNEQRGARPVISMRAIRRMPSISPRRARNSGRGWRPRRDSSAGAPCSSMIHLSVLNAARDFGIAWIRAVRRPDSGLPPQSTGDFAAVDRVADLM